jgi:hypothetical protein
MLFMVIFLSVVLVFGPLLIVAGALRRRRVKREARAYADKIAKAAAEATGAFSAGWNAVASGGVRLILTTWRAVPRRPRGVVVYTTYCHPHSARPSPRRHAGSVGCQYGT